MSAEEITLLRAHLERAVARYEKAEERIAAVATAWLGVNVPNGSAADFDRHNAALDRLLEVDTCNGEPLALGAKLEALEADVSRLCDELARVKAERDAATLVVATGGRVVLSPTQHEHLRLGVAGSFNLVPRCESTRATGAGLGFVEQCLGAKGHRGACFGGVPPPPAALKASES